MTSRADQGKQPFWGPGQPLVVDQWSSQFGAAEVPVHRNLQDLARRAKSCKIPRTTTRNLDRISTSTLAFAGLFQLTHEMIKRSVLDDVKGFYGFSNAKGRSVWLLGRDGQ